MRFSLCQCRMIQFGWENVRVRNNFFYIKFNFTKPKALQLEQKTNKKPFIENQKPNRAVLGQTSHELTETV